MSDWKIPKFSTSKRNQAGPVRTTVLWIISLVPKKIERREKRKRKMEQKGTSVVVTASESQRQACRP